MTTMVTTTFAENGELLEICGVPTDPNEGGIMWEDSWRNFASDVEKVSPECKLVMDYLLNRWGIRIQSSTECIETDPDDDPDDIDVDDHYYSFTREKYSPGTTKFVLGKHSDFVGLSISVYNISMPFDTHIAPHEPYFCMFQGYVLTLQQQRQQQQRVQDTCTDLTRQKCLTRQEYSDIMQSEEAVGNDIVYVFRKNKNLDLFLWKKE